MKELFLIIIFFHFGLILNIDIDIKGNSSVYNLTLNETYNFYAPVEQMAQIEIRFGFINFTKDPFDCVYINEYSSRNGTSIISYKVDDFSYYKSEDYDYHIIHYNLENFSSTYISFSFKSNITIENVLIELYFYGGLFNLSNGIIKKLEDLYEDEPYYLAIPVCNSRIKVELISDCDESLEDLELTIIEYQKNNSNYYIYEKRNQNYTIDYIYNEIKIISFNYVIKNNNTNFFCLKIQIADYISYLNVSLSEDRYYFNIYDKKSLDIFDLKPNQTYHFSLEAKTNNLIIINYNIFSQDFNDTHLPLESIFIYEDKSEVSFDYLSNYIHYIKALSESFSYAVSQSETKYLSLNITPQFQIEKFTIAYNITKEIKTSFNLENNALLSIPELYPYITYELKINSKFYEVLKYEIIIKNSNISFPIFKDIHLIENPSKFTHEDELSFEKDGNVLKANSSYKNNKYNTEYSTFLIESYKYVELFSIKVNVIEDNYFYLAKEVKKNIAIILSKKEYYFQINYDYYDYRKSNKSISVEIKYKSNQKYSAFHLIYYYIHPKYDFRFRDGLRLDETVLFSKNGNEFNTTFNIEPIKDYDIYLLLIESEYNLDDFNIEYKLVETKKIEEKKSGISKGLKIGLIVACVIFFIGIIASIARYCSRKNANSNLIDNNINENANLLPQEIQETQEENK